MHLEVRNRQHLRCLFVLLHESICCQCSETRRIHRPLDDLQTFVVLERPQDPSSCWDTAVLTGERAGDQDGRRQRAAGAESGLRRLHHSLALLQARVENAVACSSRFWNSSSRGRSKPQPSSLSGYARPQAPWPAKLPAGGVSHATISTKMFSRQTDKNISHTSSFQKTSPRSSPTPGAHHNELTPRFKRTQGA